MRIGRLIVSLPIWGFLATRGSCNCYLLWTPLVSFTWLDKECKCRECKKYTCTCPEEA